METTATIPSRADQPQLFQDPSIATPASITMSFNCSSATLLSTFASKSPFSNLYLFTCSKCSGVLFREARLRQVQVPLYVQSTTHCSLVLGDSRHLEPSVLQNAHVQSIKVPGLVLDLCHRTCLSSVLCGMRPRFGEKSNLNFYIDKPILHWILCLLLPWNSHCRFRRNDKSHFSRACVLAPFFWLTIVHVSLPDSSSMFSESDDEKWSWLVSGIGSPVTLHSSSFFTAIISFLLTPRTSWDEALSASLSDVWLNHKPLSLLARFSLLSGWNSLVLFFFRSWLWFAFV